MLALCLSAPISLFLSVPSLSLSVSSLHVLVEKHGITLHVLVKSSIVGDFSCYFIGQALWMLIPSICIDSSLVKLYIFMVCLSQMGAGHQTGQHKTKCGYYHNKIQLVNTWIVLVGLTATHLVAPRRLKHKTRVLWSCCLTKVEYCHSIDWIHVQKLTKWQTFDHMHLCSSVLHSANDR